MTVSNFSIFHGQKFPPPPLPPHIGEESNLHPNDPGHVAQLTTVERNQIPPSSGNETQSLPPQGWVDKIIRGFRTFKERIIRVVWGYALYGQANKELFKVKNQLYCKTEKDIGEAMNEKDALKKLSRLNSHSESIKRNLDGLNAALPSPMVSDASNGEDIKRASTVLGKKYTKLQVKIDEEKLKVKNKGKDIIKKQNQKIIKEIKHFRTKDQNSDELTAKEQLLLNKQLALYKIKLMCAIAKGTHEYSSALQKGIESANHALRGFDADGRVRFGMNDPSFSAIEKQLETLKRELDDEIKKESIFSFSINYFKIFNQLVNLSNELLNNKNKKLRVNENSEFVVKSKKMGMKSRKGSSPQSQRTLEVIISLLKTGSDQHLFTVNDQQALINLKTILLSELVEVFEHHPNLKGEFVTHFDNILTTIQPEVQIDQTPDNRIMENTYKHLLDPLQEKYRENFLLISGWLPFIKATAESDEEISKRKNNIQILINHMKNQFESNISLNKKIVLELATGLVKRRVVPPEAFQFILKAEKDPSLQTALKAFDQAVKTAQAPASLAQDQIKNLKVQNNTTNLEDQFRSIAKGNMTKEDKENFMTNFMEDLNLISSISFKSIAPSEFHRQAWAKKREFTPNIISSIKISTNISNFISSQILLPDLQLKERVRLIGFFLKIAEKYYNKTNDYSLFMAFLASLNSAAILSVLRHTAKENMPTEKAAKKIQRILEHYSNLLLYNNKLLKDKYKEDKDNGKSYIPYLGIYLTEFTFIDDGNPDIKQNEEMYNNDKLNFLVRVQKDFEDRQQEIDITRLNQFLNYNVKEIVEHEFPANIDKNFWEQAQNIKKFTK